jgi:hypothetical protein
MMHLPSYSVAVWPVPAKLPTYMDAVTAEHPLRQFVGKDRYAEVAGLYAVHQAELENFEDLFTLPPAFRACS